MIKVKIIGGSFEIIFPFTFLLENKLFSFFVQISYLLILIYIYAIFSSFPRVYVGFLKVDF